MKAIPWQSEHESGDSKNKERGCCTHSLAAIPFPGCFQMCLCLWLTGWHQRDIKYPLCTGQFLKQKRKDDMILFCCPSPIPTPYSPQITLLVIPGKLPLVWVAPYVLQMVCGLVAAGEKEESAKVVWKAVYKSLVPSRHQGCAGY